MSEKYLKKIWYSLLLVTIVLVAYVRYEEEFEFTNFLIGVVALLGSLSIIHDYLFGKVMLLGGGRLDVKYKIPRALFFVGAIVIWSMAFSVV